MTKEALSRFTGPIREAYDKLGYRLGWEFLYTPAATLECRGKFVLVGINPGGEQYGIAASVESGNAYLVEQWSPDGTRLQAQVRAFFAVLAAQFLGDASRGDELLNETLTTNFCPFRSPTWEKLPNRSAAVAFSESLWNQLLSVLRPRIILSMGSLPYSYLQKALAHQARACGEEHLMPTGWGNQRFAYRVYERDGKRVVLARFPHFSRYRLMSRPNCTAHVRAFVSALHSEAN